MGEGRGGAGGAAGRQFGLLEDRDPKSQKAQDCLVQTSLSMNTDSIGKEKRKEGRERGGREGERKGGRERGREGGRTRLMSLRETAQW